MALGGQRVGDALAADHFLDGASPRLASVLGRSAALAAHAPCVLASHGDALARKRSALWVPALSARCGC